MRSRCLNILKSTYFLISFTLLTLNVIMYEVACESLTFLGYYLIENRQSLFLHGFES